MYHDDLAGLRVILHLIGSQDPGGIIETTHEQVAVALSLSRTHVTRCFGKAMDLGLVLMKQRGIYELQPSAFLRGGNLVDPHAPRSRGAKVDQLSILSRIRNDPKVPEAFRQLTFVDATLPEPPKPRARQRRATKPHAEA